MEEETEFEDWSHTQRLRTLERPSLQLRLISGLLLFLAVLTGIGWMLMR